MEKEGKREREGKEKRGEGEREREKEKEKEKRKKKERAARVKKGRREGGTCQRVKITYKLRYKLRVVIEHYKYITQLLFHIPHMVQSELYLERTIGMIWIESPLKQIVRKKYYKGVPYVILKWLGNIVEGWWKNCLIFV